MDYLVLVRSVPSRPRRFAVSVPCTIPSGHVQGTDGQRGGRGRCQLMR
ncbi:hypothetical protein IQ254_09660 [Nodosilinea sp. LEGE 07088]|nr:hypothetical protein [Nodosilinea sp. LEGE 07088]MBE9137473.1 hypothetical protein [Nodosilinea sp. LEGE 07088]